MVLLIDYQTLAPLKSQLPTTFCSVDGEKFVQCFLHWRLVQRLFVGGKCVSSRILCIEGHPKFLPSRYEAGAVVVSFYAACAQIHLRIYLFEGISMESQRFMDGVLDYKNQTSC